jgi:predicted RNA-binding Zn ribbon-like protein
MMREKGGLVKPFEMTAGHPALDLVNTLDDRFSEGGPVELLASYDDLLRFVRQAELISDRQFRGLKGLDLSKQERSAVLAEAIQLRESLATVLYAHLDDRKVAKNAVKDLEAIFQRAAGHRRLVFERKKGNTPRLASRWEFKDVGRESRSPAWLLAQSANDLLSSTEATHIRRCASSTCQWLFLDISKNHTRRWCDMKVCGNRNKARRFYLRQADGGHEEGMATQKRRGR